MSGIAVRKHRRLIRLMVIAAIMSVFLINGALGVSAASAAPICVLHSLPSEVESGLGPAAESSIIDVLQVECQPIFSQNTVTIQAKQLSAACHGTLSWSSPYPYATTTGPSFTVTLDNDGNATAVVWGGPSCAPITKDLITASLNAPPFTTVTTNFAIVPPVNTKPGVYTSSVAAVEDDVFSSVAVPIGVEFPSNQAEKWVEVTDHQLYTQCNNSLLWVGPLEHVIGTNVDQVAVQLDDNGNAILVALGGPSCASGTSTIVADLTTVPYTTFTTKFTVLSPRPTV